MVDTYGLAPEFEAAVLAYTATDRHFYAKIGHALKAALLTDPRAQLALKVCQAVAKDTGRGPGSMMLVGQRLRRWQADGLVGYSEARDVIMYLADALDEADVDATDVAAELVPIVRRLAEKAVVRDAVDTFTRQGDLSTIEGALSAARSIGVVDESCGVRVGSTDSFAEIASMRNLDKLPTGMDDVDLGLGGGLSRGQFGLWLGETGSGKSMATSQTYATGLLLGMHCAYATTELPDGEVLARVKAALSDVETDEIMGGSLLAEGRILSMRESMGMGWVKSFTANATTVPDLLRWMDQCEQLAGRPVDLLCIDYLGHLTAPKVEGSYKTGQYVADRVRRETRQRGMWTWSNHQAQGRQKRKRIDTHDIADSMHIARSAHVVISLNPGKDGEDITFFVAKNTSGKSRFSVGPVYHERHMGRVAPSTLQAGRWRESLYEGL